MGTIAVITAALLGGLLAGLPGGYWAGYWHGRADGRLAERTRFMIRDLRRAEAGRRAGSRHAEGWYREVTAKRAAEEPRALGMITTLPDGYRPAEFLPAAERGWDMPEHTAWTGPQQALGGPEGDPDRFGRSAAVMIR